MAVAPLSRCSCCCLPGWFREEFGARDGGGLSRQPGRRTPHGGAATLTLWLANARDIVAPRASRLHADALRAGRHRTRCARCGGRRPSRWPPSARSPLGLGPDAGRRQLPRSRSCCRRCRSPSPIGSCAVWNARPDRSQTPDSAVRPGLRRLPRSADGVRGAGRARRHQRRLDDRRHAAPGHRRADDPRAARRARRAAGSRPRARGRRQRARRPAGHRCSGQRSGASSSAAAPTSSARSVQVDGRADDDRRRAPDGPRLPDGHRQRTGCR